MLSFKTSTFIVLAEFCFSMLTLSYSTTVFQPHQSGRGFYASPGVLDKVIQELGIVGILVIVIPKIMNYILLGALH